MSGCLWRNRKAMEGVSRAALGHLTCIWSFVADNQTGGVVTAGELKALGRGNPNASRWVKELVGVRFLEAHPDGYLVHDYREWNRLPDNDANEGANRDANRGADKSADRDANESANNPQSMITGRYAPVPRAHVSQDPGPKTQEGGAHAPDSTALAHLRDVIASHLETATQRPAPKLDTRVLSDVLPRVRSVARIHGCSFDAAAQRLADAALALSDRKGKEFVWALQDVIDVPVPAAKVTAESMAEWQERQRELEQNGPEYLRYLDDEVANG